MTKNGLALLERYVSHLRSIDFQPGLLSNVRAFNIQFYSGVNLSSAILQFGVLPFLLKRVDERRLWLIVPSVMLLSAVWTLSKGEYSLSVVAMTFGIFKALEYSLRSALTEMVSRLLSFLILISAAVALCSAP